MAKIKAKYASVIDGRDPMPVLQIDDVDLVKLGGLVGWQLTPGQGNDPHARWEGGILRGHTGEPTLRYRNTPHRPHPPLKKQ